MPRNVNLDADPNSIEGYFIKGLRAAGLTNEQIAKQLWINNEDKVISSTKKISDLSDVALADEWHYWNEKITNATSWGAALTAASEFKKECETEIRKRDIKVTSYNS